MTRKCGYSTKKGKGPPCENDVADNQDHCAANHPCPPAGSKAPKAAKAKSIDPAVHDSDVVNVGDLVGSPQEAVSAELIDQIFHELADTEEMAEWNAELDDKLAKQLLGADAGSALGKPNGSSKKIESPEERATRDQARGETTAQRLVVDVPPLVVAKAHYHDTVRGTRPRRTGAGEAAYRLDRFGVENFTLGLGEVPVLAHGKLGAGMSESWYLETPCTDGECTEHAYLRLHNSGSWFAKLLPPDGQKRRDAFVASLSSAKEKVGGAKCFSHVGALVSSPPESDVDPDDD